MTIIKPDGTLIAHEGFLDEAEGTIFELAMPNGMKMVRIASKPNRTRVADRALGVVETVGIAKAIAKEAINANNNEAATQQQGQQQQHTENMTGQTVPNPNDGVVEAPPSPPSPP